MDIDKKNLKELNSLLPTIFILTELLEDQKFIRMNAQKIIEGKITLTPSRIKLDSQFFHR